MKGERIHDVSVVSERAVAAITSDIEDGGASLVLRTFNPGNGALITEQPVVSEALNGALVSSFVSGENEANVVRVDATGNIHVEVFDVRKGGDALRTAKLVSGSGTADLICSNAGGAALVCLNADARVVYYTELPVEEAGASLVALQLGKLDVKPQGRSDSRIAYIVYTDPICNT
jgi:hypothetical protein